MQKKQSSHLGHNPQGACLSSPEETSSLTHKRADVFHDATQLYVENGVYLSHIHHANQGYRLGATTPRFRHELSSLPMQPRAEDITNLQAKGLWLMPDHKAPKVGIVCCGLGAVWPGMGRELYDTFPVARAAMDRLAAVAEWDVLALLDEKDPAVVQKTRWQMPYLYLIEYAQYAYLQSLGFAPQITAGHSLGELIALCFAGRYTPEVGWEVFERRAKYMDSLEKTMEEGMGMMLAYAKHERVMLLLQDFPELYISNHNSPTQFILSGKKELLAEARRILRKEKCPALNLPVSMAFHNPYLHVLRESALQELHSLPSCEALLPTVSNVTAVLYPEDRDSAITSMVDLDENTVRWVDCVRYMWNSHDIRHFVELGPTDTLCNLIGEIEPQAICIPASLKNREVKAMREAVAQLYAHGHIPTTNMRAVPLNYMDAVNAEEKDVAQKITAPTAQETKAAHLTQNTAHEAGQKAEPIPSHVQDILAILADATGHDVASLRPSMDLRHHLAIRSNRFPAIMYAVEQKFAIRLQFEHVLHVATIQDFADVIARLRALPAEKSADATTSKPVQQNNTPVSHTQKTTNALCYASLANTRQSSTAPAWQFQPWPTEVRHLPPLHKRKVLVIFTGEKDKQENMQGALDALATLGYTFLFVDYAPWSNLLPPLPHGIPAPSQLAHWETLGARYEILKQAGNISKQEIQSFIHFHADEELPLAISQALSAFCEELIQEHVIIKEIVTLHSENTLTADSVEMTSHTQAQDTWEFFSEKHHIPWRSMVTPPLCKQQEQISLASHSEQYVYAQELHHFFPRCYLCSTSTHIRWYRDYQKNSNLEERLRFWPYVFPLTWEVAPQMLFTAQRNFSFYADAREKPKEARQRIPHVSLAMCIRSLYEAALFPLSWHNCSGFDNLILQSAPDVGVTTGPTGVTREGLLQTHYTLDALPMLRTAQAELSLRAVSANGRRLHTWHPAAKASLLLEANSPQQQASVPNTPLAGDISAPIGNYPSALWPSGGNPTAQKAYIDSKKAFTKHDALGYIWVSLCVEFLQECLAHLCPQDHVFDTKSIEYVRHVSAPSLHALYENAENLLMEWCVVTQNEDMLIVDAQVTCSQGLMLLTVQHMVITIKKI